MEDIRAAECQTLREVTVVAEIKSRLQPSYPGVRGNPCGPLLAEYVDFPPGVLGLPDGYSPPPHAGKVTLGWTWRSSFTASPVSDGETEAQGTQPVSGGVRIRTQLLMVCACARI